MSRSAAPRDFDEAIRVCFTKYWDFSGKAGLPEYWWFVLFAWVLTLLCNYFLHLLTPLVVLALIIPLLAVQTRRLHDIDKSAAWLLLLLIPVIGALILLYWSTKKKP